MNKLKMSLKTIQLKLSNKMKLYKIIKLQQRILNNKILVASRFKDPKIKKLYKKLNNKIVQINNLKKQRLSNLTKKHLFYQINYWQVMIKLKMIKIYKRFI